MRSKAIIEIKQDIRESSTINTRGIHQRVSRLKDHLQGKDLELLIYTNGLWTWS